MKSKILIMAAAMGLAACGTSSTEVSQPKDLIGKSTIKIDGRKLTPEALWSMGRIGAVNVSETGKIVYTVTYYSVPQDKGNSEVFVMDADGSNAKQITFTAFSETSPVWIKNGSKIAFVSAESGSHQLWEMDADGANRLQLSNVEGGIEGFKFSRDEKKVVLISEVQTRKKTAEIYPDLPNATGLVVNDLMYKHWDEWVYSAPHPFIADFDGTKVTNLVDALEGEPFEAPMRPFGGVEQLDWSADGSKLAYTSRKKEGMEYAVSTNSDIYVYDLKSKETVNITEGMMGYDTNPQYSPDGTQVAWLSMERDGYEADQNRLFVMDLKTGAKKFISEKFKSNVDDFVWSKDGKSIYFIGVWHATSQMYAVDVASSNLSKITDGVHDYGSIALCGDGLIGKRHAMSSADEIFTVNLDGNQTQISFENKHVYDQVDMGKVEKRWLKTTDGKEMLTWVIYPPHFDPAKKYPTLLYCQGGPQSPVSQFWSFRWNPQLMAANDYIIVAPNRRGLPGFGLEWNEQISGDYGGQVMKDYFTAIDELSKEPFVDTDKLGCVGASFGGYSVYWLAGNHDNRFKAFIAHDGIFNMEMQYLETEEMWFANWDMGGSYWDTNNKTAQRTFANSPHKFVGKWNTPILCIHGEKDYRILANQGMAAFNAAVLRGVPAELLVYPDENHWVLKPQNGILWQRTFFNWLDKWLK